MIKTILMDVDDTLLDFSRSEQAGLALILERYGLPPAAREEYRHINRQYWSLFEAGGIQKEDLLVRRFQDLFAWYGIAADCAAVNEEYLAALGTFAYPLPGAEGLCQSLARAYTLCVATNGTRRAQESRMHLSGLEPYFTHFFISEAIGAPKPSPRFFEAVFTALDHPDPATVIILGDSLTSDMAGGRAAGIHTCWYNPRNLAPTADCDHVIQTLEAFPAVLRGL